MAKALLVEVVSIGSVAKGWHIQSTALRHSYSFAIANLDIFLTEDIGEELNWIRLGVQYMAGCVSLKGFSVQTERWFESSFLISSGINDTGLFALSPELVTVIEEAVLLARNSPALAKPSVSNFDFTFSWACMNGSYRLAEVLASEAERMANTQSLLYQGLQLAASCGHASIVGMILSTARKSSIRLSLDEPLFQSCARNHESIVERLLTELDTQQLPTAISLNEMLAVSCKRGSYRQVQMLLSNAREHQEERTVGAFVAITPTISMGRVDILQLLIDYDSSAMSSVALLPAIEPNRIEMVKYILSLPITLSPKDVLNSFMLACELGHLEICTHLLLPSPTTTAATFPSLLSTDLTQAFLSACESNHPDIVELLLVRAQDSIDPTTENNRPIRYAASQGFTKVVRLLLDLSPDLIDPSALDDIAFRNACERGYLEIVERLLEDPVVDPAAGDNAGLRMACEYGHIGIVKILLQLGNDTGVDPGAQECYALRAAARNGHWDVVELLVNDGRCDLGVREGYVIRLMIDTGNASRFGFSH
ncbi:hypothetical protein HDU99_003238, partial [Rhizoclosmatium hyalinum]